jgi:hypothetical protein
MKLKSLIALSAFVANAAFAGTITNGDFGTGDTTGWTSNASVSVGNNGTYSFAQLFAGLGANVYTTLSQTVHLNAGDVLTGSAQFLAHDYLPFNDDSFVSINGTNVFASNVAAVGDFGTSALTSFSFTAPTDGDYVILAGVENVLDNGLASELQVSNFSVSGTVPEPASIALLGLGAMGFAAARRKSGKRA